MDIEALLAASDSEDDSVVLAGYSIEDLLHQDTDSDSVDTEILLVRAEGAGNGAATVAVRKGKRARGVNWDLNDSEARTGAPAAVGLGGRHGPEVDDILDEHPGLWGAVDELEIESEEALLERILAEDGADTDRSPSEGSDTYGRERNFSLDVDEILSSIDVEQSPYRPEFREMVSPPSDRKPLTDYSRSEDTPRQAELHEGAPTPVKSNGAMASSSSDRRDADDELIHPLVAAEMYEKLLLRSSNATPVSPLRLKRRSLSKKRPRTAVVSQVEQEKPSPPRRADSSEPLDSAGPIRVRPLESISAHLAKNAAYASHGPGLPTVLGVHPRFIALGTSRALILLFDEAQQVKLVLGKSGDAQADGAVSAIDINGSAEYIASAYVSGKIILWDLQRGTPIRVVTDSHACSVSIIRFSHHLDPVVISVDVEGCVSRVTFSKSMFSNWAHEVECLLDGAAGPIPILAVLPNIRARNFNLNTSAGSRAAQDTGEADDVKKKDNPFSAFGLIALSSERSSFVVACSPVLKVIHKWARPAELEGESLTGVLPCLAWSWTWETTSGSNDATSLSMGPSLISGLGGMGVPADVFADSFPLLARAWGRRIQFLGSALPDVEAEDLIPTGYSMSSNLGSAFGLQEKETAQPIFPAFGVRGELFAGAPVVALEWLQTGMLLYLDDDQFMCVYDTYRGCELQNIRLQSLPVHVSFAGLKPEANPRSFSSSFRGCEVGVFLLSTEELRIAKLQTIKQRIDALVDAGEWLSALGLSLDHFDDVIMPRVKRELQQRKARLGRAATSEGSDAGVETSHSSNPEEWTWTEEDRELIELNMNGQRRYTGPEEEAEKLLLVYLDLGVSNAPKEEKGDRRTGYSLANSHYQMLAGVCMEYCCLLRRPDLLFGSVYDRFRKAGRQSVFLDLLEPFITSGQLTTIGAEAMEDFLGMTSSRGDLRSVERSLLRIQVQALDFNRIIPLLRRHKLFSALARVFVKGLGDYLAPVESMAEHVLMEINRDRTLWEKAGTTIRWQLKSEVELELLRSSFGSRANSSQSAASESGWSHWRGSLYKLLLYLKLSFAAKTFPEGSPLPRGELYPPGAVVRAQMLWFVFHPDPSLRIPIPPQKENRIENLRYPVLQAMLMSDTASALEVLSDGIFKASVSEHEILEQDGRTGGTLPAPPAGDAGTGEGKQVDASRPVWEQLRDIGDRVLARLPTNATSATSAGLASGVAAFPEAAIEGNVVEVPRFFAEETDDESVRERCRMYKRSSVWNETSLSWGAELPSISFLVRTVYKTVFHPHAGFSDDVIRACPQYAADARQAVLMFIAKAMLQALDDQVPRLSGNDVTLTLLYRVCAQLIREERDGTTLKFLRSLPSLVLNILTPRLLQTAHDCKRFKVALVLHTRALRCCVLDSPVPPCTAGLYVGEQLGLKLPSSSALGLNATSQEDAAIVPKQHMAASIFSYLRVDAEMPDSALPPRRHRGNPGQHAAPGEDNIGIEDSVFAFLLKQLQELKSFCIRFPDPEEIPTDSRGPAFGLGSPSASIGKGFSSTFLEAVEKLRSADLDMEFTTITGEEFDQTMLDPSLRHELLGADVEILKGWWARRISAAALVREVVQVILAVIGPLIHKDSRMSARLVAELADLLPSLDLESSLRTARSARASKNFMDQVMEALKADPTAQFKLLRVIVNGELNHGEEADPMAANLLTVALTQNDKKFYLNLLAHYQPDSVYDYIVKNDTYALDETLQLCNRLKITDATVYLLERSGDTVGALTMMLTSLSKRLDKLRDLLEKAFRADNGGGLGLGAEDPLGIAGKAKRRVLTSPRSIGVKIQSADAVMLVASTKEGQSIDRAITVVLDICQRNTATIRSMAGTGDLLGAAAGNASSIQRATNHNSVVLRPNVTVSLDPGKDIVATDPPQEAKQDEPAAAEGEGLWFSVLDELLRLRMKYIREDLNSSGGAQREIAMQMQSVVLLLIQRVLNGMMGHVSLENMVTRITERGASVKLGDFRDVLSSLFDAYEYEAEMYRHASQIVRKNVALRKMQQLVVQRSGVPIQRVDDTPLPYSLKDWGHGGPPKIIFRGRGVLSVNPETASAETVIIGSRKSQSESSEGATKDSGMNPFLARRLRKRRTFLKAQLQVTSLSSYKGEISKNWRPFGAHPTAPLSIRNATSKSQREMPKLSPNASSFPARATYVREVNPIDAAGLT